MMGRLRSVLRRVTQPLNREGLVFLLACLLALGTGYGAWSAHQRAQEERRDAITVRRLLVEHREVLRTIPRRARRTRGDTRASPLAYLEETLRRTGVSPDRVGELTPAGTDGQNRALYRLRVQSVQPATGLSLLRRVEEEGRLSVVRFSLERTSTGSKRFDLGLRLRSPRPATSSDSARSPGPYGQTRES